MGTLRIRCNEPLSGVGKQKCFTAQFLRVKSTWCTGADLKLKAAFVSICQYQTYQLRFIAEYQSHFKIIFFKLNRHICIFPLYMYTYLLHYFICTSMLNL